eukprot:60643-Rhodomonas_salina.1
MSTGLPESRHRSRGARITCPWDCVLDDVGRAVRMERHNFNSAALGDGSLELASTVQLLLFLVQVQKMDALTAMLFAAGGAQSSRYFRLGLVNGQAQRTTRVLGLRLGRPAALRFVPALGRRS